MTGWTCACGATGLGGVRCGHCGNWAPWYTPPPLVAPPAGPGVPMYRGLDAVGRTLAVAIVLLLVGGVVGIDHVVRTREGAIRAEFAAAVRELSDFVAAERGAAFRRPVEAYLLDDEEFGALLYVEEPVADSEPAEPAEPEPPTDFGATMYSLRMADESDDVDGDAAGFDDSVVGFYDEETKAFYARGTEVTPYVRLVIVHELVHAWQDQHHDLARVEEDVADSDAYAAVEALIEGDATRVEERWLAAQSDADRAAIEREERSGGPDRAPTRAERSLGAMYEFPYVAGADFVTALHERGGNAAVDAAFRRPPTTTEQVLHPERYLRKHGARPVRAPEAPVDPVDEGTLGEIGLALVVARGNLDDLALTAASGWGGDAYVTWDDGTELCTAVALVMDTQAARDRLVTALGLRIASTHQQVVTRGPTGVRLRFCVPSRGR